MYEASLRIFSDLSTMIRPGVSLAEVGRAYQRMVQEEGLKPMSWPFHGRGLGDDHPAMANAAAAAEAVFAENHVIILKPGVASPDDVQEAGERAGDTVVITRDGCRRLGQRPLRISEIPLL
jgi:Xaa-Pro aminopeptidase